MQQASTTDVGAMVRLVKLTATWGLVALVVLVCSPLLICEQVERLLFRCSAVADRVADRVCDYTEPFLDWAERVAKRHGLGIPK